jgi:GTP-dependent phosphoenolpyruvate carboxykinase
METLRTRLAQHQARKLTTDRTVRAKGHQRKIQTVQENLENTHMEKTLQQGQKERNTSSLNSYDPVAREKAGTMINRI